jgi:hypothetical protein
VYVASNESALHQLSGYVWATADDDVTGSSWLSRCMRLLSLARNERSSVLIVQTALLTCLISQVHKISFSPLVKIRFAVLWGQYQVTEQVGVAVSL